MAVETRVIIDANASNAIKEIGKLDDAAADADATIKKLDDQDVGVDTSDAVADLGKIDQAAADAKGALDKLDAQQVALTADTSGIATAAGDVDALQADAGTAITIPIDVDADKLDNVKGKLDQVGESGRAGGTAIGGIGGSISELPGVGALGPIAESLGQLTENALEGGESIAGIGQAIGILGGTALVMKGIQTVMQNIADTKAFNDEKAKAFKDAIDDVGDSAKAVLDVIKETKSVTGRAGGIFGTSILQDTKDITAQLDAAGVSVDDFALAVQAGGAPLDEAVGKLQAMRDELLHLADDTPSTDQRWFDLRDAANEYGDAIEILKETHKTYSDQVGSDESWSHWIEGGDTAKETGEAWNRTLQAGIGWMDGTSSSARNLTGKTKELAAGYEQAARDADSLTLANSKLRGDLDQQGAYLRLQEQFDETKRRGTEAMEAVATKSSDADSKMRDYELSVIDSKIAVQDFNTEWTNVPLDQQLNMNTQIDRGEFDQVIWDVGRATSTTHWIDVRVRTTIDQAWQNVTDSLRLFGARATGTKLGPP